MAFTHKHFSVAFSNTRKDRFCFVLFSVIWSPIAQAGLELVAKADLELSSFSL